MARKPDIGAIYPEPPRFNLAAGSQPQYLQGLEGLLAEFEARAKGESQFDYLKYLFEPQKAELSQQYGINVSPDDIFAARSGVLPQTLAGLNQRGLLDAGTSGIIEGQVRSNYANQLAELFGGAKQLQRTDIDNALQALNQLYPQRFQVQNIPSSVDYFNNINSYNTAVQRNAAQQAYEAQQGPKTLFGQLAGTAGGLFGGAAGYALGGPTGAQLGSQFGNQIGNMFGGQSAGYKYQAPAFNFNPYQTQSANVGATTPGLSRYYQPLNYASLFGGN